MSDYDFEHAFELDQEERHQRMRAILLEEGRPDLLAEYEAKLRDIRLGIEGARGTWHALSQPQRRVLAYMVQNGGELQQNPKKLNVYFLRVTGNLVRVGRPTVRNLAARELLAWDGGAFEPEARAVLTERGRFVLKHGQQP
jgi:hypothetical protein